MSATNQADNTTMETHDYVVLSAAEATGQLLKLVTDTALDSGLSNSLTQILIEARDSANRVDFNAASGQINAFINAVTAQLGKKIVADTADQFISEAQKILVALTMP